MFLAEQKGTAATYLTLQIFIEYLLCSRHCALGGNGAHEANLHSPKKSLQTRGQDSHVHPLLQYKRVSDEKHCMVHGSESIKTQIGVMAGFCRTLGPVQGKSLSLLP